jgi:hypothetical protein
MARLRLAMPATLLLLTGTYRATLLDLSRSGARIALDPPVKIGSEAVMQVPGLEAFGTVIWQDDGYAGLRFDRMVSEERMLALRNFADTCGERSDTLMRQSVHEWVSGTRRVI